MALLEVTNLGISFGGLRAVDEFNLSIEELEKRTNKDYLTTKKFLSQNSASLGCPRPKLHWSFGSCGRTGEKRVQKYTYFVNCES